VKRSVRWAEVKTYTRVLCVFLLVLFAAACSRQIAAPSPSPATLLRAIVPADSAKYSGHETKHWENPYLAIRPEGIALLTSVDPNEEQILKPDQVLNVLAQLPASAWPYGRVVAILLDEKPSSSETDKIAIRRSRGILEGDLQSAAVEIHWMNASQ
jgi:hypothetical protein